MVTTTTPHMLHHLLSLLSRETTLVRNDLTKHKVDLTSHVRSIAANVERRLLLEQVADKLSMFAESVLDINLLR